MERRLGELEWTVVVEEKNGGEENGVDEPDITRRTVRMLGIRSSRVALQEYTPWLKGRGTNTKFRSEKAFSAKFAESSCNIARHVRPADGSGQLRDPEWVRSTDPLPPFTA